MLFRFDRKIGMKKCYHIFALSASLALVSCNESGRGNDRHLNADRNQAAAESNTDKFAGKKKKDAEFVYEVVASSYAEIKLAEVASQKSRTPEVKKIAEQLLADHTSSLNALKTLAQAQAISVPVEESDVSKRKLENMAEESGHEFDRNWCEEMTDLHERDIDRFENRLDDTENTELRTFITETLAVLKKHHESLRACQETLKKKQKR